MNERRSHPCTRVSLAATTSFVLFGFQHPVVNRCNSPVMTTYVSCVDIALPGDGISPNAICPTSFGFDAPDSISQSLMVLSSSDNTLLLSSSSSTGCHRMLGDASAVSILLTAQQMQRMPLPFDRFAMREMRHLDEVLIIYLPQRGSKLVLSCSKT